MKGRYATDKAYVHCYPGGSSAILQIVGITLIAIGLLLLFICIPGWAWAAILGILFILIGYFILRLNSLGR